MILFRNHQVLLFWRISGDRCGSRGSCGRGGFELAADYGTLFGGSAVLEAEFRFGTEGGADGGELGGEVFDAVGVGALVVGGEVGGCVFDLFGEGADAR